MTNIKIVTDSSCTMEEKTREELEIYVVPLSVMVDGVIYRDDDLLSGERFMDMMKKANSLPKTSQPPIGEFVELYDELGKDGSQIVSIHMTETLSGTVEAARQAAQLSKANVTVIDSTFTDQSLSFQVIEAAKLAKSDAKKEEILANIEKIKNNSKLYIGIATLDNLVKGGRVSRVNGILSNLFNMKIVMELVNGQLEVQIKGRGNRTFTRWFDGLKNELAQLSNVKKIGVSYAGSSDLAKTFQKELHSVFPNMDIPVLHTDSVIATHAGKGAFAIMFYTE